MNVKKVTPPILVLAQRIAKHSHIKAAECYDICKEMQLVLQKADAKLFGDDLFKEKQK